MSVRIPPEQYQKMVIEKCEANHIWLNKIHYLHPTDDMKIKLADVILEKLNRESTQISSELITSDCETARELAELTPILYMKVNWS